MARGRSKWKLAGYAVVAAAVLSAGAVAVAAYWSYTTPAPTPEPVELPVTRPEGV